MRIRHAISLWNYTHYANAPSLERVIDQVRRQGYGIELWGAWGDEQDLYGPTGRRRLRAALGGMEVSLHTAGAPTLELHKKQVDAAADLGAQVIVLHPGDLAVAVSGEFDAELAGQALAYASAQGVRLALENGPLAFLTTAIAQVEGLGICLDVGHVYLHADADMGRYLATLKHRLIHLHIQDILPQTEAGLPHTGQDHFIPGTGGIPLADWELLGQTLREIDFHGTAVFEIQPCNPLQTALLGTQFLRRFL